MKGNEGFSELMTIRAKMLIPKITSVSQESISTEKASFTVHAFSRQATLYAEEILLTPDSVFAAQLLSSFESALTKQMEHVLPKQKSYRSFNLSLGFEPHSLSDSFSYFSDSISHQNPNAAVLRLNTVCRVVIKRP